VGTADCEDAIALKPQGSTAERPFKRGGAKRISHDRIQCL
jgi:hypothetical protein